jgi:hypothetical protein
MILTWECQSNKTDAFETLRVAAARKVRGGVNRRINQNAA